MSSAVRSTFVTVLAWIFIVLSGFATMIAVLQNIMMALVFPMAQIQAETAKASEQGHMPWFASFMFGHIHWFFLFFLVVCACMLAASIGLLKRRNWARILFIALMALGIAWNVGGLIFMFFAFSSFFADMPVPPDQAAAARNFEVMWKVMFGFNLLMVAGFAWLFGWIIKRLTSGDVRREFTGDAPGA